MFFKLRENDKAIMYYNSDNPEFKFQVETKGENPTTHLYRNYREAMLDYEKENENMIDLTKNNESEITLDKINELIKQYTLQEVGKAQVDEEEIIDNYLCLANIENIINKLEKSNLLQSINFHWEERVLRDTDFESVEDLIFEYDNLKSQYDEMKDAFGEIYTSAQEIIDSADEYR